MGSYRKDLVLREYVPSAAAGHLIPTLVVVKARRTPKKAWRLTRHLEQDDLITAQASKQAEQDRCSGYFKRTTLSGTITRVAGYVGSYYA